MTPSGNPAVVRIELVDGGGNVAAGSPAPESGPIPQVPTGKVTGTVPHPASVNQHRGAAWPTTSPMGSLLNNPALRQMTGGMGQTANATFGGISRLGMFGPGLITVGIGAISAIAAKSIGDSIINRSAELARFSPDIAVANAFARLARFMNDFREAQLNGGVYAQLISARSRLEQTWAALKIPINASAASFGSSLANFAVDNLAKPAGAAVSFGTVMGNTVQDVMSFPLSKLFGGNFTAALQEWAAASQQRENAARKRDEVMHDVLDRLAKRWDVGAGALDSVAEKFFNDLGNQDYGGTPIPDPAAKAMDQKLNIPAFSGMN